MYKFFFILFLTFFSINLSAIVWQTNIYDKNIHTLQVFPTGKSLDMAVIKLNSDEKIRISFDEMTFAPKLYNYKIVHCNGDFSQSSLLEQEYINGFPSYSVSDFALSENTLTLYTNYMLTLPENDFSFKVSGNYAVLIAEDNNFDKIAAVACFSVVENIVKINLKTIANTDIEFNGKFQQVEMTIDNSNYPIQNVFSELKVNVFQNRRKDNAAIGIKPTFTATYKQTYNHNHTLIFEGGNQYRLADFSSEYSFSGEIDKIETKIDYYNVFLMPADYRSKNSVPTAGGDADGRFQIHRQRYENENITADYMWVHFILPAEKPFEDGNIYILGDLTNNVFDENSKMEYDFKSKIYHKALFLKQGGYSFLYAFLPKNSQKAVLQKIEGSFWQTENEYSVMVYHRSFGERYDRLIGFFAGKY
jgi:hypothetical protein